MPKTKTKTFIVPQSPGRLPLRGRLIEAIRSCSENAIFLQQASLFDDPKDEKRLLDLLIPQLVKRKLNPTDSIQYYLGQMFLDATQLCVDKKTPGLSKAEFWELVSEKGMLRSQIRVPPDLLALLAREIVRARIRFHKAGSRRPADAIAKLAGPGAQSLLDNLGDDRDKILGRGLMDNLYPEDNRRPRGSGKSPKSPRSTLENDICKIGLRERRPSRRYFESLLDMPQSPSAGSNRKSVAKHVHAGDGNQNKAKKEDGGKKSAKASGGRRSSGGRRRPKKPSCLLERKNR